MGQDLCDQSAEARDVFDRVASATEIDIKRLCWSASEDELRQTENAQLALYTCGLAGFAALAVARSIAPSFFAGHSVGEYAALAAAGVLSVEEGARLVAERGRLMANSGHSRPGTMAAVLGLDRSDLDDVCAACSTEASVVTVANDNCPGQIVISGDVDAVQRASAMASERGAKRVMPLNVSGAFHSPLMTGPAEQMGVVLKRAQFLTGTAPVVSNVTAQPVTDSSQWPDLLERQLSSPVRWRESVLAMHEAGVRTFIECGSGEVLTGLLRRIAEPATGLKVLDGATLAETTARLEEASVSI